MGPAFALGDAVGESGLRARERQVHGDTFAGSDKFATKEVVRGAQAAAAGGATLDTALGVASLDSRGLYRVEHHGHRVIWVPAGADSLKKRLLVCAHLEGTGHRGVDATVARLERHCVWEGMADHVRDMTRLCLYCTDTKQGALVPRMLEKPLMGESRTQLCILMISTWGRVRWTPALTLRTDFRTCWIFSRM